MVLVWNENAIKVMGVATTAGPPGLGQGPPLSPLHLAMVQGAVYDAVNAIDGGHEPFLDGLSAPSTASKAAAEASRLTGEPKADLYRRLLALKD